jgi:hypothetical protein
MPTTTAPLPAHSQIERFAALADAWHLTQRTETYGVMDNRGAERPGVTPGRVYRFRERTWSDQPPRSIHDCSAFHFLQHLTPPCLCLHRSVKERGAPGTGAGCWDVRVCCAANIAPAVWGRTHLPRPLMKLLFSLCLALCLPGGAQGQGPTLRGDPASRASEIKDTLKKLEALLALDAEPFILPDAVDASETNPSTQLVANDTVPLYQKHFRVGIVVDPPLVMRNQGPDVQDMGRHSNMQCKGLLIDLLQVHRCVVGWDNCRACDSGFPARVVYTPHDQLAHPTDQPTPPPPLQRRLGLQIRAGGAARRGVCTAFGSRMNGSYNGLVQLFLTGQPQVDWLYSGRAWPSPPSARD